MDPAIEKSYNVFINSMSDYFQRSVTISLIKLVCFTSALVLCYAIIFERLLELLKEEMWLTQGMLNLIPINMLLSVPRLKEELLKQSV